MLSPQDTAAHPARAGLRVGLLIGLLIGLFTASLAGCAPVPPQPWQKGQLARPEMAMDADGLEQRFSQHVYGSKENSAGGQGVGGGGCGCN